MRVFHEIVGEGPPLVLLNGVMMTTQSWVLQTRALGSSFSCVLHDFRGQLRTPADGPFRMRDHVDDLTELLDLLGIESAHLAGTSYGGEVGMTFALAHPQRVRSLSVIASVSEIEPPLRSAVELWRDTALHDRERLYAVTAPYNFSPALLTDSFIEQGRTRLAGYPPQFFTSFAALCDAFLELDITTGLPGIGRPTLVVAGAKDILKPPHYSERIARAIPNARLEVIPDAPHACVIENAAEVNALLLGFLTG